MSQEAMQAMNAHTLMETLDITMLEATSQRVRARMPITSKVHQPFGLLHGGASVALAETVASIGGWLNVDQETQACVGQEINANHLRDKREGEITAEATPIHLGRTSQVWDIRITDEDGKLVCVSRCTLAVIARK